MRRIILAILITFSVEARTTFEQIVHNQPQINQQYARRVATIVDRLADKYKVPANVLAGIMMVESNYQLNVVNAKSNDYGILQINQYHINNGSKFDKVRLLTDLEYSIEAGFIVFKWFYKTYPTLEEAVKRYNVGTCTNGCLQWETVVRYWNKVRRYK